MATNEFLVFNKEKENMMSQNDYENDSQIETGLPLNSIAVSSFHNKLYHQLSTMVAAIGEFIVDSGFDASDEDIAELTDNIKNAIAVNLPDATETISGKVMIATAEDIVEGTDNTKAVTPAKLRSFGSTIVEEATTTTLGTVKYTTNTDIVNGPGTGVLQPRTLQTAFNSANFQAASNVGNYGVVTIPTDANANTATGVSTVLTASQVRNYVATIVKQATESIAGIAQIATASETQLGTNDTKFVTPKKLKDNIIQVIPEATTVNKGIVQFATDAEVAVGTSTTKVVNPKQLRDMVDGAGVPDATTSIKGIVQLATQAEVTTGTNTTKAVTPQAVAAKANLASPTFTGTPSTSGKFTNTYADTVYNQAMFRNIFILPVGNGAPANTVGINGDIAFERKT